ncbi:NUDIX hydrolase [Candidatus Acetothermia bacterium]|jgi:ADP-ribose pyrophosphatase YjhB (NUDIX family)|nr:NUDIX hydrolase [Candidatus Acetothermia bacterium]MCI2426315.1 NUDIX hydrolase [Candidatus Acetothermia bacterium]MCI2427629.1 NUDIX hydrolase [Candidatus Acetothermia bacterium]MCI2428478.1 NUDIX hydrolase [Candidatus Acetothermia bacterium]
MQYYIEADGRVFTIERNGILDLPRQEEIPFSFTPGPPIAISKVCFGEPTLDRHPREWLCKDELIARDNVTSLMRQAIHATMPRVVVEGIITRDDRVLLVKSCRGLTKGRWSLPGGFVSFGESPATALERELFEELRVQTKSLRLISVEGRIGNKSRLHWIYNFYHVEITGTVVPNPDEISEADYFPLSAAIEKLHDIVMRQQIESLYSKTL